MLAAYFCQSSHLLRAERHYEPQPLVVNIGTSAVDFDRVLDLGTNKTGAGARPAPVYETLLRLYAATMNNGASTRVMVLSSLTST